jgi:hypothetical protein
MVAEGPDFNNQTCIYPGDFNGDGKTDALSHQVVGPFLDNTGTIILRLSNDSGFDVIDTGINLIYDEGPQAFQPIKNEIYVADYNGDGRSDFLMKESFQYLGGGLSVLDATKSGWSVYLSNGSGFILSDQYWEDIDSDAGRGENPPFVIGDFNGDGKTDLLMRYDTMLSPSTTYWDLYLSNGNSLEKIKSSTNGPTYKEIIHTGDFNADGKTDLLATWDKKEYGTPEYDGYRLYLSDGSDFILTDQGDFFSWDNSIHPADFNGDGVRSLFI